MTALLGESVGECLAIKLSRSVLWLRDRRETALVGESVGESVGECRTTEKPGSLLLLRDRRVAALVGESVGEWPAIHESGSN